jgi:DNA-binding PadR family transcriptional regulator
MMNPTLSADEPPELAPLNHTEFQILLALADAERHGYGIIREVTERSGGSMRLGPGTLYGAIKRMLAAGVIEESDWRPESEFDDDRRRCYYRLTSRGRQAAAKEARRLADLVVVAQSKRLLNRRLFAENGGMA